MPVLKMPACPLSPGDDGDGDVVIIVIRRRLMVMMVVVVIMGTRRGGMMMQRFWSLALDFFSPNGLNNKCHKVMIM